MDSVWVCLETVWVTLVSGELSVSLGSSSVSMTTACRTLKTIGISSLVVGLLVVGVVGCLFFCVTFGIF